MKHFILIALLLCAATAGAETFGDSGTTATFTFALSIGELQASTKDAPDDDGTLDSIAMYLKVPTAGYPVQFFVRDSRDSCVVDSTARTNLSDGEGWYWLDVVEGASIESGVDYYIGGFADAGDTAYMKTSGEDGYWGKSALWSGGMGGCYTSLTQNFGTRAILAIAAYTPTATATGPPDHRHGPDGTGQRHGPDGASTRHKP